MPKEHLRIGIDPDIDKSGFALIDTTPFGGKILRRLENLSFWALIQEITALNTYRDEKQTSLLVCIEAGWLNKKSNFHPAQSKEIAAKIGMNVGQNHCVGQLIERYCKENCIPYKLIKPETKKWDARLFKMITKYERRTNQEQRDAARAAW